jgi:hypothetical protein
MGIPAAPAATLLAATLAAAPGPAFPPAASERAAIWNGFEHAWTYNHRLSRLGSFTGGVRCDQGVCDAPVFHAAATGSGSDSAAYSTRVTTVHAPGVGFLQGMTTLRAEDARGEGRAVTVTHEVRVPAHGLLAGRTSVDVVMGGFDLLSRADPDKLARVSLAVHDARYIEQGEEIAFDIDVSLTLDCDSLECRRFDRGVAYDVSIAWTLMAADTELAVTNTSAGTAYEWGARRHSAPARQARSLGHVVDGLAAGFDAAFVAFRSLAVAMDDDYHIQGWDTRLTQARYDAWGRWLGLGLDLFVSQWGPRDKRRVFSFEEPGQAQLAAGLAVVQLRDGEARSEDVTGDCGWRANGRAADPARSLAASRVSAP